VGCPFKQNTFVGGKDRHFWRRCWERNYPEPVPLHYLEAGGVPVAQLSFYSIMHHILHGWPPKDLHFNASELQEMDPDLTIRARRWQTPVAFTSP
jgi:hypothetical protein